MQVLSTYFLYISILLIASSFGYIAQYCNDFSARITARFVSFATLLLPAALRYGIGTDYPAYIEIYQQKFPVHLQRVEPGFKLIGLFCNLINIPPHLFIVIIAGITYALICFDIPRKYFFPVICFFVLSFGYLNSFSMIRQSLAISLLLCGLFKYYNGKKLNGYIYFAVAFFFHYSSIIIIPIILLSRININNVFRILLCIFTVFIIINNNFSNLLFKYIVLAATFISPRLAYVLESNNRWGTGLSLLIYALPSLIIIFTSYNKKNNESTNFVLNINFIYIIIVLFAYIIPTLARLTTAALFILLFSVNFSYSYNKKYSSIIFSFLIVSFFALFIRGIGFHQVGARNSFGISPYMSIFSK